MFAKKTWNTLQLEQIETGRRRGLSEKQIRIYARHSYDFLQMEQLRLAMEHGLDPYRMKPMRSCRLTHQQMESMRIRLERGEEVFTRMDIKYILACTALGVMTAALILEGYLASKEHAYLNLKTDTVTLSAGTPFDPMSIVDSYPEGAQKLKLPETLNTETPSRQAAVYRLKAGNEEITRIVWVITE